MADLDVTVCSGMQGSALTIVNGVQQEPRVSDGYMRRPLQDDERMNVVVDGFNGSNGFA